MLPHDLIQGTNFWQNFTVVKLWEVGSFLLQPPALFSSGYFWDRVSFSLLRSAWIAILLFYTSHHRDDRCATVFSYWLRWGPEISQLDFLLIIRGEPLPVSLRKFYLNYYIWFPIFYLSPISQMIPWWLYSLSFCFVLHTLTELVFHQEASLACHTVTVSHSLARWICSYVFSLHRKNQSLFQAVSSWNRTPHSWDKCFAFSSAETVGLLALLHFVNQIT
jgi:hypothetical protein